MEVIMKKFGVGLTILITITAISCTSPPKVFESQDCRKLQINTEYYYAEQYCTGAACKANAKAMSEDALEQCMQQMPMETQTKDYMSSGDGLATAVGAATAIATGFGVQKRHYIEVFKIDWIKLGKRNV